MRARLAAIFAVFAVGAAYSQSAAAQVAPTRSGHSTMQYFEGEAVMAELAYFGRCYATQQRAKALRLLATDPTSLDERKTYIALFKTGSESCLNGMDSVTADVPVVRGAIAEGMYLRGAALPPEMMLGTPALAEVRDLSGAARCYVGAHPAEARALIADTKPGSRKEADAVKALLEDFFQCVPEGARSINLQSTVLRYRIAEALLRTSGPLPAEAREGGAQ